MGRINGVRRPALAFSREGLGGEAANVIAP